VQRKEQAPEDPRISDTLGWLLYKRGVHQRALGLLKESAAKLPSNPQVQITSGWRITRWARRTTLARLFNSQLPPRRSLRARMMLAGS
jgi:hypothetical protein